MKGKFLIFYDWSWKEETPCLAGSSLPHNRVISAEAAAFKEAREKLIEALKLLPENEPIPKNESVKIC